MDGFSKLKSLIDGEKLGGSISMNFNNINACEHALEVKIVFKKLTIPQKQ